MTKPGGGGGGVRWGFGKRPYFFTFFFEPFPNDDYDCGVDDDDDDLCNSAQRPNVNVESPQRWRRRCSLCLMQSLMHAVCITRYNGNIDANITTIKATIQLCSRKTERHKHEKTTNRTQTLSRRVPMC